MVKTIEKRIKNLEQQLQLRKRRLNSAERDVRLAVLMIRNVKDVLAKLKNKQRRKR